MKILERHSENMIIQFPAHSDEYFLAYYCLKNVDIIFHQACRHYGSHIQGAVKIEQIKLFHTDGDIDNLPLHFKRIDLEKQADNYQSEKEKL